MSRLVELSLESDFISDLTLEGKQILESDDTLPIFVVLTDTKTRFSKISRWITKEPYNHVSIALDEQLNEMYTFALVNKHGTKGGFKRELKRELRGAHYSMYKIEVDRGVFDKVNDSIQRLIKDSRDTRYNHAGLINVLFNRELFRDSDSNMMICSQFVMMIFQESGVELFKNRAASTIRPYEFVKSKLLSHVRRGVIR